MRAAVIPGNDPQPVLAHDDSGPTGPLIRTLLGLTRADGGILFGGRGALGIPPMATWAMISVIVGWIVVWSVVGAWRMMTRDA